MNWKTLSPITILLIVILALVGTVGVIWGIGQLAAVQGTGTVVTAAILTSNPPSLTWGPITVGTNKNITLTLTNNGETDTALLSINSTVLPQGLMLTNNSTAPIPAGTSVAIEFTLDADSTATLGAFTHTVTIDG